MQSAGWDMHADGNNPGIRTAWRCSAGRSTRRCRRSSRTSSSAACSTRCWWSLTGDFGRTPKINSNGGRDHWANLCTLALFGGGLKMGQVIGQSRPQQRRAGQRRRTRRRNLLATVMHTLFDVGTLRVARGLPANLVQD